MPRVSNTRLEKLERFLSPAAYVSVDFTSPEAVTLNNTQREAVVAEAHRQAGPFGEVVILAWPGDWTPECGRVIQLTWGDEYVH